MLAWTPSAKQVKQEQNHAIEAETCINILQRAKTK